MRDALERPLAIVGNLNLDLWVQTLDRFPGWDEELIVDSARVELAGTAGYMMLACKGLGMEPFTVSTIGDDALGQILRQNLEALGFSDEGVEKVMGEETSLGMIFISGNGDRSILSTLGAHKHMDMNVVERHDTTIARCKEVILCGNYLLPQLSPSDVLQFARNARSRGQLVLFDPSWDPSGWVDHTRESTYRLLEEVNVYLPNEEELLHLTGKAKWQTALDEVRGMAPEIVLKRGARGAVYVGQRQPPIEVPGFPVNAVNTIGAGDVFDIGYLFGRRMGWQPEQRVRFACALAAIVVSCAGTRVYPDAATVLSFIQEHGSAFGQQ